MLFIFIKLHLFHLYHKNWTTENIIQKDFYSKKRTKKTLKTVFFSGLGFLFIKNRKKPGAALTPGATLNFIHKKFQIFSQGNIYLSILFTDLWIFMYRCRVFQKNGRETKPL